MPTKIKVLYEDSNILAIEKPSGILVHPDGRSKPASTRGGSPASSSLDGSTRGGEKTILDLFLKKYPKLEIVHRLDRETSGVLLLAKNKKAHEFLKSQFKDRKIKKIYHAIVSGNVKNERGIINKPIGRSPRDFRRWLAGRGARGEMREAITEYRVLKRFQVPCVQNFSGSSLPRVRGGSHTNKNFTHTAPFTYLEIRPKTGRTHQIRVHMKYLNHPVVCDSLYNPDNPCPKGISRVALHAKSIEFKNLKGETKKVESSLPTEFKKIVE
jgi:23S rRNA pseudouridine1911/1915/1917 synthase